MLPRPTRLFTVPVLAASILAFSACGSDSPTGNSGDALTAAEAEFLVSEFFNALELIQIPLLDTGPAAASGLARTPYGELYDPVIAASGPCAGGGLTSVNGAITGDVDETANTADITASATVDFTGCVVPGETISYTLNGNPDVGLTADIAITQTSISIDIGVDGAVSYETTDGRSGSCALDLTVAASQSALGFSQTLGGTACGASAGQFDIVLFD